MDAGMSGNISPLVLLHTQEVTRQIQKSSTNVVSANDLREGQ
jgi:hypothetical protein